MPVSLGTAFEVSDTDEDLKDENGKQREDRNWTLRSSRKPKGALIVLNTLLDCLELGEAQADGNCFFYVFLARECREQAEASELQSAW